MLRGGPGYREYSRGKGWLRSKRRRPGKRTTEFMCLCVSKDECKRRKDNKNKNESKKTTWPGLRIRRKAWGWLRMGQEGI